MGAYLNHPGGRGGVQAGGGLVAEEQAGPVEGGGREGQPLPLPARNARFPFRFGANPSVAARAQGKVVQQALYHGFPI